MTMQKPFFWTCLILSILAWCAGYVAIGKWVGTGLALLLGLTWLAVWKYSKPKLASLCLLASILLGAGGILMGAPTWLMLCGAALALTAWDLLLLILALKQTAPVDDDLPYERQHFKLLLPAAGGGLLAALLGQFLSFQVPFFILLLLSGGIVFILERVWRSIRKRHLEV
jgi:hypothetical protein